MALTKVVTANGEEQRFVSGDFAVVLDPEGIDNDDVPSEISDVQLRPAITRSVKYENSSNVASTTTQCGDTFSEAYGNRFNDVYTVECIVTDYNRGNNLSLDVVMDYLREGRQVKIVTLFRATVIQVTDVTMKQTQDIVSADIVRPDGDNDTILSAGEPAVTAQFQFGEKESE